MDFEKFYDRQGDYEAFRNDPAKREEYNITVDWKARQLASLIEPTRHFDNILEVGCALGILLDNLAGRLKINDRTGLDISAENIKVARDLYPGVSFFQGTIRELKKELSRNQHSPKFDIVLLSDIVEHIPEDLEFMKEVKEISSYVLLNLPLEKSFSTRNREYGENDSSGHLRCYDEKMAAKLVRDAGLGIIGSFTSNAFRDKKYLEMYRGKRKARLGRKPWHLRIFWDTFYYLEDTLRISNKNLSVKLFGTNYFALLKSSD